VTRALAAAASLLAAACSLPDGGTATTGPTNTCDSANPCAAGGACLQGRCVATAVDLEGLLVEVRPGSFAPFGAAASFLVRPADHGVTLTASGSKAIASRLSPKLPLYASIHDAVVQLDDATPCGAPGRVVPATVTFYRRSPFSGLSLGRTSTTTDNKARFRVDLVPGDYDIHIEPLALHGCNGDKPYPPAFLSARTIDKSGPLVLKLPPVLKLSGQITSFPAGAEWTIDLLEPSRGLPIATGATLAVDPLDPSRYLISGTFTSPDSGTPIVRLTPPADQVQPTVYWDTLTSPQTSSELIFTGDATELVNPSVSVSASVVGSDRFSPIPGTVAIQSTALRGDIRYNATFSIPSTEVLQELGTASFAVKLPPGTYALRVTPVDNGLAVTDVPVFGEIPLGVGTYAGQQIVLDQKLSLGAALEQPSGARVPDVRIVYAPSTHPVRDFWTTVHNLPPRSPRPTSSQTTSEGSFSLLVDPGPADLLAQPDPASGFPWFVRARIEVDKDFTLAALPLPYPVVLAGTVLDPSGAPVAGAEINAWLPVRDPHDPSKMLGTVVRIATTTTDDEGSYTLLLPSQI
jgi:hypothetical protein